MVVVVGVEEEVVVEVVVEASENVSPAGAVMLSASFSKANSLACLSFLSTNSFSCLKQWGMYSAIWGVCRGQNCGEEEGGMKVKRCEGEGRREKRRARWMECRSHEVRGGERERRGGAFKEVRGREDAWIE